MERPYDTGGIVQFSEARYASVAENGVALAAQLGNGDPSPLPDGVHVWLAAHTKAISCKPLNNERGRINDELQTPPFGPAEAWRIGSMISGLIHMSNRAAAILTTSEIILTLGMQIHKESE